MISISKYISYILKFIAMQFVRGCMLSKQYNTMVKTQKFLMNYALYFI